MSKKIYIRVDKPIEPSDLVRCVRAMGSHKKGDIWKVEKTGLSLFWIFGTLSHCYRRDWEVVHELKVGDKVVFNRRVKTVTGVKPGSNKLYTTDGPVPYICNSQFELYQPKKHDPKPTLGVDYGKEQSLGIPTKQEHLEKTIRRDIMKTQIAEMIVELLDKGDKEIYPQSSVIIANWRDLDNTVTAKDRGDQSHEAKLHPDDTWDTLTGVYVALSKAAGRKLPDWIYGEER